MISNVWQVQLNFKKPADSHDGRLDKLWKSQVALAERLKVETLFVASNQPAIRDYTLIDEVLRFNCNSEEAAVLAEKEFRALMRNRGYSEVKPATAGAANG